MRHPASFRSAVIVGSGSYGSRSPERGTLWRILVWKCTDSIESYQTFNITCTCNAFLTEIPIPIRATSVAAAAIGLGVDYGFSKNLAWRIQADELQMSGAASDVRIATGIVFRLGK